MQERIRKQLSLSIRVFLAAVILLLALTSLMKFLSVFHGAKVLGMPDPVFTFWTMQQVMLAAGVLECITILLICLPMKTTYKFWLVLWTCMLFWTYRAGLAYVGFDSYCTCFGTATEWLHFPKRTVEGAIRGILWLMTIGSSLLLGLCYADTSKGACSIASLRSIPDSSKCS